MQTRLVDCQLVESRLSESRLGESRLVESQFCGVLSVSALNDPKPPQKSVQVFQKSVRIRPSVGSKSAQSRFNITSKTFQRRLIICQESPPSRLQVGLCPGSISPELVSSSSQICPKSVQSHPKSVLGFWHHLAVGFRSCPILM